MTSGIGDVTSGVLQVTRRPLVQRHTYNLGTHAKLIFDVYFGILCHNETMGISITYMG